MLKIVEKPRKKTKFSTAVKNLHRPSPITFRSSLLTLLEDQTKYHDQKARWDMICSLAEVYFKICILMSNRTAKKVMTLYVQTGYKRVEEKPLKRTITEADSVV